MQMSWLCKWAFGGAPAPSRRINRTNWADGTRCATPCALFTTLTLPHPSHTLPHPPTPGRHPNSPAPATGKWLHNPTLIRRHCPTPTPTPTPSPPSAISLRLGSLAIVEGICLIWPPRGGATGVGSPPPGRWHWFPLPPPPLPRHRAIDRFSGRFSHFRLFILFMILFISYISFFFLMCLMKLSAVADL